MNLILMGPPGAGKGTQSACLREKLGIPQVSTGEMLRDARDKKTVMGLEAGKHMVLGSLVPDEVVIAVMEERLNQEDCQRGYILDGFPRTVRQAESLDAMLEKRGHRLDAVLTLDVSQEELIKRMVGRGRDDDKGDVVRERLRVYEEQTAPVLGYYKNKGLLKKVDGLGPVDQVFERLMNAIPST